MGDINFEQRWFRLYTRKRREGELHEDYVPLNDTLFNIMRRRWQTRDKDSLNVYSFTPKQLRNMMQRLCKKAEIKPFGFHAIRHHVASVVNDSGKASMKQIQVLVRHRRQSTTETYLHVMGEGMREAISILDDQSRTTFTRQSRYKTPKRDSLSYKTTIN